MGTRGAIYTRISQDRNGGELGVQRQEADCRRLAEQRGIEVTAVFIDNDISAFSGVIRPQYAALLAAIERGELDTVIVYKQDRLTRSVTELEAWIKLVEAHDVATLAVAGGDLDVSSADTRRLVRILGALAQGESEVASERIRRKVIELAEAGKFAGGPRPYGYAKDGVTVLDAEAEILREVAARLLAGEPLAVVTADLNARGITTAQGRPWRPTGLKSVVTSGRVAGLRLHQDKIIGPAGWPAIINPDERDALLAIFAGRAGTRVRADRYLLTGMIVCGLCGCGMNGSPRYGDRRYVCRPGPGRPQCGRLATRADPVDELVGAAVLHAFDSGGLAQRLLDGQPDAKAAHLQLTAAEGRRAELAADFAAGDIDRAEWRAARTILGKRIAGARAVIEAANAASTSRALPTGPLAADWPTLSVPQRRAVIEAAANTITILPVGKGGRVFRPDRVKLSWRA